MFKKILQAEGKAFHLPGNDIDTDRIIPARFLKCVTFDGLGAHVFEDDRAQLKGKHPFDDPSTQECPILIVDENFGSGSSREHAVPALMQRGIKAIIGLSFAEIFRGNAVGNGLICVTVSRENHAIAKEARFASINLAAMHVSIGLPTGSAGIPCQMAESHRENLMTGKWDDIATCLEAGDAIEKKAASLPYFKIPSSVAAA